MSKKSYKRNQNRLYREIKRRILAENQLRRPTRFATCERKVETIRIDLLVPPYLEGHEDFVKMELARKITQKLVGDGYIVFHSQIDWQFPVNGYAKVDARLDVLRPMI